MLEVSVITKRRILNDRSFKQFNNRFHQPYSLPGDLYLRVVGKDGDPFIILIDEDTIFIVEVTKKKRVI